MTDRQTHRETDAGDLIICPMLCYSNGTDKISNGVTFKITLNGVKRQ